MPRTDFRFAFPKRVRYAEVDAQAVVFNSRYLEYLDVGITEYWREVGVPHGGFEVHVVRSVVEYRKPLRNDELFDICLRVARFGRSSMVTKWEIHGFGGDEDLRAEGETVAVHVDLKTHSSLAIPDAIVTLFENFERKPLREGKA